MGSTKLELNLTLYKSRYINSRNKGLKHSLRFSMAETIEQ